MASIAYSALYDALAEVVADALPDYTLAISSFDFDQQPHQESGQVYRVVLSRQRTEGYMGGSQAEIHRLEVWITRRINRSADEAESFLRQDLVTLEDALLAAGDGADYNTSDDDTTADVSSPGPDEEYIVGRLSMLVDSERQ